MRLVVAASLVVAVAARTVVPPGAPARTDHAVNHVLKRLKDAEAANSTTHFYHDALLDHFESDVASPTRKWSQRYYVDESFWGGAGYPVFLYIGGEGPQGPMSPRMFI
ncbi:serine-type peptidase [Aureococcus anophagefferens]|nr:serine-type peptidase [Aureococcus anophagefferens]